MSVVPKYVQIEEDHSYIRDTSSMAVINIDRAARLRHRAQREKILSDKARISNLEFEVANLKELVMKLIGEK